MNADNLIFRPMKIEERESVAEMIKELYHNLKVPDGYMANKKIASTFEHLQLNPSHTKLEVFELDGLIVGYALLFKFWYNELGGMILNVDELFVRPECREQGIASCYLSWLSEKKNDYVALTLEVLPANTKAFTLYKRTGFIEKETVTLYKLLD